MAPGVRSPASRMAEASALMTLVMVIFGGYSVVTSVALSGTVAALAYALLRDVLGSALLLGAAYAHESTRPAPRFWPDAADVPRLLLCGVTGCWGAQGLSALAIKATTPAFFSTLEPTMPIATLALAAALRQEPMSPASPATYAKVCGIAVAVAGAVFIVVASSGAGAGSVASQSANFPLGVGYLCLQLTLGGAYPVVQVRARARGCGWRE